MADLNPTSIPPGCRDRTRLLVALRRDAQLLSPRDADSTSLSYPEFLRYFRDAPSLTVHHLIIGASFTYSWMPTMLDFRSHAFERGVATLEAARGGQPVDKDDLLELSRIVNNSLVGASKLLHFAAPARFAIWDSRVAKYLRAPFRDGMRGVSQYCAYNEVCVDLASCEAARATADIVFARTGTRGTVLRALELLMYHRGVAGHTYLTGD